MTSKEAASTREGVHWASFRGAVADLQQMLGGGTLATAELEGNPADEDDDPAMQDVWTETAINERGKSQDEPNHHIITGLEEVNKGVYSRNNTIMGNTLTSPVHAPSQASAATQALSIAEHQLAETKLKLALTESERDELEFQLMQSNKG